jgi:hypothetical protein
VTLTVKNGDDLAERFATPSWSPTEYGNAANAVAALCRWCCGCCVVLRSEARRQPGQWHPHLHMIALG